MEESIEARVPPELVWEAWEKAHAAQSQKELEAGQKGVHKSGGKFRYQVLEVKKGESFSIMWKTLFVRLIFSHSVRPLRNGSEIRYQVKIKGLFAWAVRWFLEKKIQSNIRSILKALVYQLESQNKRV